MSLDDFPARIAASKKSIYDAIEPSDAALFIPSADLERLLNDALVGTSVFGLAPRTRSKVVKERVCTALGYPVPRSFAKTKPRFVGQNFDIYNQQALNLQIWNEEIDPGRRYVLVRIDGECLVTRVRVLSGADVASYDRTGTLTTKYQASPLPLERRPAPENLDTPVLRHLVANSNEAVRFRSPSDVPAPGELLPITAVREIVSRLIGKTILVPGREQDRARGELLHRAVCDLFGYETFGDTGQFPDIRNQLIEVKLQTSRTIDLGRVLPSSQFAIEGLEPIGGIAVRHCDTRYAVFLAHHEDNAVVIDDVVVCTGENFFAYFRMFEGLVVNGKLQVPLPASLF